MPSVGAGSRRLAQRTRAEGFSSLADLEAHYTGGETPMSPVNYVWYQYRWLDLAARMLEREGDGVVTRVWDHLRDRAEGGPAVSGPSLARDLSRAVSPVLGRAVERWR